MRAVICRAWGAVEDLKVEEVEAPAPAASRPPVPKLLDLS